MILSCTIDNAVITSNQEDKQKLLDNLRNVSESREPIEFQIDGVSNPSPTEIYRERQSKCLRRRWDVGAMNPSWILLI